MPDSSPARKGGRTDEIAAVMESDFEVFRDFLPLASGIETMLAGHFPDDPSWRVLAALRRHVSKPAYHRSLLRHQQRYNLDGDPVGEVTEAQRLHARQRLEALAADRDEEGGEDDPLGDITAGFRLLLCKQIGHRFGKEVARQCRPFLEALRDERTLEQVGLAVLDCESGEEFLARVRNFDE